MRVRSTVWASRSLRFDGRGLSVGVDPRTWVGGDEGRLRHVLCELATSRCAATDVTWAAIAMAKWRLATLRLSEVADVTRPRVGPACADRLGWPLRSPRHQPPRPDQRSPRVAAFVISDGVLKRPLFTRSSGTTSRPSTPRSRKASSPRRCPPSSVTSSRATSTVACSAGGNWSQTEYVGRSSPSRVVITRRHHPAEGKTFVVVRGGPNQLVIRLDDDSTMRIPRSWTDADGPCEGTDAPKHVFTVDALRELGALVASLARRCAAESADATTRVDDAADAVRGGDS
jgi:hypothetical protein